jgi:alpha-tubulin suppressor-like RCC1 family protein
MNWYGELGADPELVPRTGEPVPVSGGLRFTQVSAGLGLTCGLTTSDVAHCWGMGRQGQLGNGAFEDSPDPVAVVTSQTFESVSVGMWKGCGLTAEGLAFCWGAKFMGFGTGDDDLLPDRVSTPILAASGMTWDSFEAGADHACAIDPLGHAFCWGAYYLQDYLGLGPTCDEYVHTPSPVVGGLTFASLDAHKANYMLGHICGVTPDNQAYCWGANTSGRLGGPSFETCTAREDYPCSTSPVAVQGGVLFTSVTVGSEHTCGLGTDGIVYCWGSNSHGQLGNGTFDDSQVPVPVALPTVDSLLRFLIGLVEDLVTEGTLNGGQGNALISKLENCLTAVEGSRTSASGMLGAFINQVAAFINDTVLPDGQGRVLIDIAEAAFAMLEG